MVVGSISEATSGKVFSAQVQSQFHGPLLAPIASCSAAHLSPCSVPIVGVCTTINDTPPAVEDTARLFPDMPIVVVGDVKGPHGWTPPPSDRNAHSLLGDFGAELPLYQTASEFVRVIDEVTFRSEADTIPAMLEQIYVTLYEHGMLDINDVFAIQQWIRGVCELTAAPSR